MCVYECDDFLNSTINTRGPVLYIQIYYGKNEPCDKVTSSHSPVGWSAGDT